MLSAWRPSLLSVGRFPMNASVSLHRPTDKAASGGEYRTLD
jgi:hypothetical protein